MRMPVPPSFGTLGKILRRSSSVATENHTHERAGGERPRLRKVPCWASGAGLSPAMHFRSRCPIFRPRKSRRVPRRPPQRKHGSRRIAGGTRAATRPSGHPHGSRGAPGGEGLREVSGEAAKPKCPRIVSQKRSLWGISRVPEYKGDPTGTSEASQLGNMML